MGPSLSVKDNLKGPVLRQSGLNFQTLNFRLLGLLTVGLGKGHNILVGEPRRKTVTFFTLAFPILGQIRTILRMTLQKKKKSKPNQTPRHFSSFLLRPPHFSSDFLVFHQIS